MQQAGLMGCQGQPVMGEGSVSMVLTTDPEGAMCEITGVSVGESGIKGTTFSAKEYFGCGYSSSAFDVYAAACCLQRGTTPDGQTVEELVVTNRNRAGQVSYIQLKKVLCD
jgi:hypothetical protein